jgi:hypothetical protein
MEASGMREYSDKIKAVAAPERKTQTRTLEDGHEIEENVSYKGFNPS